jgi:hypothetical protein
LVIEEIDFIEAAGETLPELGFENIPPKLSGCLSKYSYYF